MRVLIVRLGAFGDIVHTLPLAADLDAAGCQVHWLCEDRWSCLLAGSAAVTQVHQLPRAAWKRQPPAGRARLLKLRRLVRELRAQHFDAVIDAQGLAKSALWAALSGAKIRIGHRPPRAREASWLLSQERSPATAEHVIDQQRALSLPLLTQRHPGRPWRFPLPAWAEQRAWAQEWLAAHDLHHPWVLNVGAGWPSKVWPAERQAAFVAAARSAGHDTLVVWGSPAEHDLAVRAVAEAPGAVLAPATDIPQLGGLLAQAGVLVSGDTGPLHLSLALGTPAVGLFGPVPARRNGPRGGHYRCLQAPGAAWERKDAAKGRMDAISVEQVMAAASEVAR
ncbi:MAG: glycosyltransferase family 9 protein [Planctomycetota bacterium]|jgi:heptosyltransferase-1|nr:glycosyltransferase family 9 protein [Planctomycetota bacterium]